MGLVHAIQGLLGKKRWPADEEAWLVHSRDYWARGYRDDSRGANVNAPQAYWQQGKAEASYTPDLLEALSEIGGVESALELGCNVGRNLYNVARAFPEATLTGLDINPDALAFAREHVPGSDRWALREADLTDPDVLEQYEDSSVDVVYSMAVLVHLPPGPRKRVLLDQCRRISRKAIVLIEPHTEGATVWNRVDDRTMSPFCIEDYRPYLPGAFSVRPARGVEEIPYHVITWRS